MFFGNLIGLNNLAAVGNATAIGPMPIQTLTRGLFPVGVQFPATMSYGTTYTLSEKSSGQFGPGNWGLAEFPAVYSGRISTAGELSRRRRAKPDFEHHRWIDVLLLDWRYNHARDRREG